MSFDAREAILRLLKPLDPIPVGIESGRQSTGGEVLGEIRAVLFDIYGTLLVSGSGDVGTILESKQQEKRSIRLPLPSSVVKEIPETMARFIEEDHAVKREQGIDYPEVEIRDIWGQILDALMPGEGSPDVEELALLYELQVNPVWCMPGFPEIVRQLRSAGLLLGIVSNAQFYTPLVLEALCGQDIGGLGFDSDLCAWSYRMGKAKPSVDLFGGPLSRLESRGILANQVMYIGNDRLNDITAASGAGCRTALFAGDARSLRLREGDRRVDAKEDILVTSLQEFAEVIVSLDH